LLLLCVFFGFAFFVRDADGVAANTGERGRGAHSLTHTQAEWATIVQAAMSVLRALRWPLEVDLASWCARAERLSLGLEFSTTTQKRRDGM
jgi:hypothetical protein